MGLLFFVRHPLVRSFLFSDGMQECAEAGCYWLLDVLATEIQANSFKQKQSILCIVQVVVKDQKCKITGEFFDGDTEPYTKKFHLLTFLKVFGISTCLMKMRK